MITLILASASPRRKDLLEQIKVPFTIIPSEVDENISQENEKAAEVAMELAYQKASDVVARVDEGIVLGADTIVVIDGEILGKPKNGQDAIRMLNKLSNREHEVITGVALINAKTKYKRIEHEVTKVKFIKLTSEMINSYVQSGEPEGKAGAYAIQGMGIMFVEKINGCYTNVVGLPLVRMNKMLEHFPAND